MGIIDFFRNGSIPFCKSSVTFCNDPQRFRNASLRIVQATASTRSGRVHSPTWGGDVLCPNDFGEDLFLLFWTCNSLHVVVKMSVDNGF